MPLLLVGAEIVHLDRTTFMWVQVTEFAFDIAQNDRSVLESLIASPGYAHDYASRFNAEAQISEPAVHGRWRRDELCADLFVPWSATEAEAVIRTWADQQEWTHPGYRQPPSVHARLQPLYQLLRSGHLYKLNNPDTDAEHEYGFVTGSLGFHEFVAIDRTTGRVHVVVASDD